jgi:hypothetical protein
MPLELTTIVPKRLANHAYERVQAKNGMEFSQAPVGYRKHSESVSRRRERKKEEGGLRGDERTNELKTTVD